MDEQLKVLRHKAMEKFMLSGESHSVLDYEIGEALDAAHTLGVQSSGCFALGEIAANVRWIERANGWIAELRGLAADAKASKRDLWPGDEYLVAAHCIEEALKENAAHTER